MDYSTEHHSRPPSEKQAIFSAACELIQRQLPLLLKRVLRNVSQHEQWPLSDKEKLKLLQLLEEKERIVISSFMFHVKQNLDNFEKSGASPLRVVPKAERSNNEGIYAQFNESLMQRLSNLVGRPSIPLTENPVHLFNLKQSWNYAIDSLLPGATEKSILTETFDQQLVPQLGAFYRALDNQLFKAGILPRLPVARLNLRDPQDYTDTVTSSLGEVGIEFSHLIMHKRQQLEIEQEQARKLEQMHDDIKRYLADDRSKLDKRQAYFFDNLWLPYLTEIAMAKGTESKHWTKALGRARQFNEFLAPRHTRTEIRHLLETADDANQVMDKALNKMQTAAHQKQVLRNFFDRSVEAVLQRSVENVAHSISASRPLSAQANICREAEEFRRLFENLQLPASAEFLDRVASAKPVQPVQNTIIELREGDWAEMVTPRSARKMLIKLAWKAGDLSKYIFVDRSGKRVCELNDAELRKKMASGEIQAINQTGSRSANQNLSTLKRL